MIFDFQNKDEMWQSWVIATQCEVRRPNSYFWSAFHQTEDKIIWEEDFSLFLRRKKSFYPAGVDFFLVKISVSPWQLGGFRQTNPTGWLSHISVIVFHLGFLTLTFILYLNTQQHYAKGCWIKDSDWIFLKAFNMTMKVRSKKKWRFQEIVPKDQKILRSSWSS